MEREEWLLYTEEKMPEGEQWIHWWLVMWEAETYPHLLTQSF